MPAVATYCAGIVGLGAYCAGTMEWRGTTTTVWRKHVPKQLIADDSSMGNTKLLGYIKKHTVTTAVANTTYQYSVGSEFVACEPVPIWRQLRKTMTRRRRRDRIIAITSKQGYHTKTAEVSFEENFDLIASFIFYCFSSMHMRPSWRMTPKCTLLDGGRLVRTCARSRRHDVFSTHCTAARFSN